MPYETKSHDDAGKPDIRREPRGQLISSQSRGAGRYILTTCGSGARALDQNATTATCTKSKGAEGKRMGDCQSVCPTNAKDATSTPQPVDRRARTRLIARNQILEIWIEIGRQIIGHSSRFYGILRHEKRGRHDRGCAADLRERLARLNLVTAGQGKKYRIGVCKSADNPANANLADRIMALISFGALACLDMQFPGYAVVAVLAHDPAAERAAASSELRDAEGYVLSAGSCGLELLRRLLIRLDR